MIARKVFDAPRLPIWLPRTLYPVPCPAAYRGAFFANAGQGPGGVTSASAASLRNPWRLRDRRSGEHVPLSTLVTAQWTRSLYATDPGPKRAGMKKQIGLLVIALLLFAACVAVIVLSLIFN